MQEIVKKVEDASVKPGASIRPDSKNPITVRVTGEIVHEEKKRVLVAEEVPKGSTFEIVSDEGEGLGGHDSAPTPLSYFSAAFAF